MILSGGRAQRFDGRHKPAVELGGQTLISRVLTATRDAHSDARVWVAGRADGLTDAELVGVTLVREDPPFSGPLAAIGVAVARIVSAWPDATEPAVTVILAGDMPLITPGHIRDLVAACRGASRPALARDGDGFPQYLCCAWPTRQLIARFSDLGETANRPVRALYDGVECVDVPVEATQLLDVDTVEDLQRIERVVAGVLGQTGLSG